MKIRQLYLPCLQEKLASSFDCRRTTADLVDFRKKKMQKLGWFARLWLDRVKILPKAEGKLRRIKNVSNGRTSPAENRRIREFPPTQFEWQQNAYCLPRRQNSTALKFYSFSSRMNRKLQHSSWLNRVVLKYVERMQSVRSEKNEKRPTFRSSSSVC